MVDYPKRLVEVDEVLKYLSTEDLNKIPEDVKQLVKNNMDKNYTWKFDTSKQLNDQELSRDTIAILSYLNMEYLLTKEQKELMEKIHEENQRLKEKEDSNRFNTENLFQNKNRVGKIVSQENSLIERKEENLLTKIFNKIKSFFINSLK